MCSLALDRELVPFTHQTGEYCARLESSGVRGESRADWQAGIAAALDILRSTVAGPLYRGRWQSTTGPNVSEDAFRAFCVEHELDVTEELLMTMVPECAANLTVVGPDALALTTRLCHGVDRLRTPLVVHGALHSGHPLIFFHNLFAITGFVSPEDVVEFVATAPVGASLLTEVQETLTMHAQWVPCVKDDEEEDSLFSDTEDTLLAVRAWASSTRTPDLVGTKGTVAESPAESEPEPQPEPEPEPEPQPQPQAQPAHNTKLAAPDLVTPPRDLVTPPRTVSVRSPVRAIAF